MTREQELIQWIKKMKGEKFTPVMAHSSFSCSTLDISRVYSIIKVLILKGIVIKVGKGIYQESKKRTKKWKSILIREEDKWKNIFYF